MTRTHIISIQEPDSFNQSQTSIKSDLTRKEIRIKIEQLFSNSATAIVSLPTNLFMGLIWNMDDNIKEYLLPKLKPYITDEIKKTMILSIEEIKKAIG